MIAIVSSSDCSWQGKPSLLLLQSSECFSRRQRVATASVAFKIKVIVTESLFCDCQTIMSVVSKDCASLRQVTAFVVLEDCVWRLLLWLLTIAAIASAGRLLRQKILAVGSARTNATGDCVCCTR